MEVIKGGRGNQSSVRTVRRRCNTGGAQHRDETVLICIHVRSDVYQHQPIPGRLGCNPDVDLCDFLPFALPHVFTLYLTPSGLSD